MIAVTSIAGNASAIPAGIIVFGDPLGSHALEVAVRVFAFLLVIGAAALIPAPTRAASAVADGAPEQQGADDGHDGGEERDPESHHADRREHEAHDGDHAGRTAEQDELVRAALARAP